MLPWNTIRKIYYFIRTQTLLVTYNTFRLSFELMDTNSTSLISVEHSV